VLKQIKQAKSADYTQCSCLSSSVSLDMYSFINLATRDKKPNSARQRLPQCPPTLVCPKQYPSKLPHQSTRSWGHIPAYLLRPWRPSGGSRRYRHAACNCPTRQPAGQIAVTMGQTSMYSKGPHRKGINLRRGESSRLSRVKSSYH